MPLCVSHDTFTQPVIDIARQVKTEKLNWSEAREKSVNLFVRRDDQLDPEISGNKFYKLHGHLSHFISSGTYRLAHTVIASFGGAYSNHLHALAAIGKRLGIKTVGFVRGHTPKNLSPTLQDCTAMGMDVIFLAKSDYAKKDAPEFLSYLETSIQSAVYWVPEGGGGDLGERGCEAIGECASYFLRKKSNDAHANLAAGMIKPNVIVTACGTSTTFVGIVKGVVKQSINCHVVGLPVLKTGEPYLASVKKKLNPYAGGQIEEGQAARFDDAKSKRWHLVQSEAVHCTGYAKLPEYLKKFIDQFEGETSLSLDPVYTAKVFHWLQLMLQANQFLEGSNILVVHSGGLQGRRGFL